MKGRLPLNACKIWQTFIDSAKEHNDKSTLMRIVGVKPLHWNMIESCCGHSKSRLCIYLRWSITHLVPQIMLVK